MIKVFKVGEYGLENCTEGMYARTNNGIIGKIINSNDDEMINGPELLVNNKIYCVERDSIKDIQKSIIDLLEVGDYVNGKEVYIQDGKLAVELAEHIPPYELLENIDIETILTKEQYMQNCYKINTN